MKEGGRGVMGSSIPTECATKRKRQREGDQDTDTDRQTERHREREKERERERERASETQTTKEYYGPVNCGRNRSTRPWNRTLWRPDPRPRGGKDDSASSGTRGADTATPTLYLRCMLRQVLGLRAVLAQLLRMGLLVTLINGRSIS